MTVLFNGSYYIANGTDRTCQIAAAETFTLKQATPSAQRARAAAPTYFPDRATRMVPLVYPVTFPPCSSIEEAYAQARNVPLQCPKGGTLVETVGSYSTTFSQAVVVDITPQRLGVTNTFIFSLEAVNPSVAELSPLALMDQRYLGVLLNITGLTGGTAGKLDAEVTADVAAGLWVKFLIGAEPQEWQLIAGTDAEDADGGIVRPDDYDPDTNAKIWIRRA